ncbi:phosphotransferase [Sporosalibacterium faouarense]|uniref:phosphotransferase n=1 Tax=Sporosalibacterium faouarense TaxID=516123 RepID=UPI00141C25C4|nr:phosphotransferase [Sporosalibacterium faouarense]MTI46424.1 hypothetical protein [Bacillota bacterium]
MLLPEIRNWKHWGEIFTNEEIWLPIVKAICSNEGICFDNIRAGYPGTNAVFILDNKYVIKIYPERCHKDYEHEVEVHKALQENRKIPIPKVICNGSFQDRIVWPYMIMEYKYGKAIRDIRDKISHENLMDIYKDLGEIVKEIHNTSSIKLEQMGTSNINWIKFVNNREKNYIKNNKGISRLSNTAKIKIPSLIRQWFENNKDSSLNLVNGDLTEDHLLLEFKNSKWQISSIIDLADSLIGQKEYEWVPLWFGLINRNKLGMETFMNAYDSNTALDEEFREKAMVFTFLHQFGEEIIDETLEKLGVSNVETIDELKDILWPNFK